MRLNHSTDQAQLMTDGLLSAERGSLLSSSSVDGIVL